MAAASNAIIFLDPQQNIYHLDGKAYQTSNDLGQSFTKYKSPVSSEAKYDLVSGQNLYLFVNNDNKLWVRESLDLGQSFSPAKLIINDFNPDNYSVLINNGIWHLFSAEKKRLYYSLSSNNGQSFSRPVLMADFYVDSYEIFPQKDKITIFANSGKNIYKIDAINQTISNPIELHVSDNTISSLIGFDHSFLPENPVLIWAEILPSGQTEIKYLPENKKEPISLYQSSYKMTGTEAKQSYGVFLLFFSEYLPDGPVPHLIRFDKYGGLVHRAEKLFESRPPAEKYLGSYPLGNKLISFFEKNGDLAASNIIKFTPQLKIEIPKDAFVTNQNTVHFKLSVSNGDPSQLIYGLKICSDPSFRDDKTFDINNISSETDVLLPLPDGNYAIKAYATDGISYVKSSNVFGLTLDRIPPKIKILNDAEELFLTGSDTIEIRGLVLSGEALFVNGKKVDVGKNGQFSSMINLFPGKNNILVLATDEASNASSESLSITYSDDIPQLHIISPRADDFYKKDSTLIIRAQVKDKTNDIIAGAVSNVFIDKEKTGESLDFDPENSTVSGFFSLPPEIADGEHSIKLTLVDSAGNLGVGISKFKIDNTKPAVNKKLFRASGKSVNLRFFEDGSGIDSSGSYLKLFRGSLEVEGYTKYDKSSAAFVPTNPMPDGNYLLEYSLRDMVGNFTSKESAQILISSFAAQSVLGSASGDLSILSLENGPNPFSPGNNETTTIKYLMSASANLELYIYNMLGDLIYKKNYGNMPASGIFTWDGSDQYGKKALGGIFPYVIAASDPNGKKYIKRGKIAVF